MAADIRYESLGSPTQSIHVQGNPGRNSAIHRFNPGGVMLTQSFHGIRVADDAKSTATTSTEIITSSSSFALGVEPTVLPKVGQDESADDTAPSDQHTTLYLFIAVVLLLFADQNLMGPNISAIAADFGLTDQVWSILYVS